MTSAVWAVLLAGAAGGLLSGPRPDAHRLVRALAGDRPTAADLPVLVPGWLPRGLAVGAAVALVSSHGTAAVLLGVLAVVTGAPAARRRREQARAAARLATDLPRAAELLAVCVEAGSPLPAALGLVAEVVGGPVAARLRPVAALLGTGADLAAGRPPAGSQPDPVDRLVQTLARAATTGAPLSGSVRDLAADERQRAGWLATERARAAGVRAVGPLAVCFLPAFVLVGVVPVVAGVTRSVLGSWS